MSTANRTLEHAPKTFQSVDVIVETLNHGQLGSYPWDGDKEKLDAAFKAAWDIVMGKATREREVSAPKGFTLVPNKALEWLFGEGDSNFNPPPNKQGQYWWRSIFRKMITDIEDEKP